MSQTSGPLQKVAHENIPRISIIGAGISGLALACHLYHRQIPFRIYEARNNAKSIGHGYAITLQRNGWRHLRRGALSSHEVQTLRRDTAVDRLIEGDGKVADHSSKDSGTFQAIDRDLRQWLVQKLVDRGIEINWNHKLSAINKIGEIPEAELSFEGQQSVRADLVIDGGGLRSPCFEHGMDASCEPRVLPYATYYGTRTLRGKDFLENYAHYFQTGNTIDLIAEEEGAPFISLQKVHKLDDASEDHAVELRWVYSRPPRQGKDPLYRPLRKPEEAKDIPPELYDEIPSSTQRYSSHKKRNMLQHIFNLSDLHDDRILNWHLRVRLPSEGYFKSHTPRGFYQIVAMGDAAHGLPIVQSQGANIALQDARVMAEEIKDFVACKKEERRTLARPSYSRWVRQTREAVQRLRAVHCQHELSEAELEDAIGFSTDGVGQAQGLNDKTGTTSSDEEEDTKLERGKL